MRRSLVRYGTAFAAAADGCSFVHLPGQALADSYPMSYRQHPHLSRIGCDDLRRGKAGRRQPYPAPRCLDRVCRCDFDCLLALVRKRDGGGCCLDGFGFGFETRSCSPMLSEATRLRMV